MHPTRTPTLGTEASRGADDLKLSGSPIISIRYMWPNRTEPSEPICSFTSGLRVSTVRKHLHVKIRGLMIWDRFRSSMSFEPSNRFLRSGSLVWSGSSLVGNGSVKDFSPNLIKSPNQPDTGHFVWRTDSRGLYKYENAQLLKQPLKQRDHLKTK